MTHLPLDTPKEEVLRFFRHFGPSEVRLAPSGHVLVMEFEDESQRDTCVDTCKTTSFGGHQLYLRPAVSMRPKREHAKVVELVSLSRIQERIMKVFIKDVETRSLEKIIKKSINPVVDRCLDIWQRETRAAEGGITIQSLPSTSVEPNYLDYIKSISESAPEPAREFPTGRMSGGFNQNRRNSKAQKGGGGKELTDADFKSYKGKKGGKDRSEKGGGLKEKKDEENDSDDEEESDEPLLLVSREDPNPKPNPNPDWRRRAFSQGKESSRGSDKGILSSGRRSRRHSLEKTCPNPITL